MTIGSGNICARIRWAIDITFNCGRSRKRWSNYAFRTSSFKLAALLSRFTVLAAVLLVLCSVALCSALLHGERQAGGVPLRSLRCLFIEQATSPSSAFLYLETLSVEGTLIFVPNALKMRQDLSDNPVRLYSLRRAYNRPLTPDVPQNIFIIVNFLVCIFYPSFIPFFLHSKKWNTVPVLGSLSCFGYKTRCKNETGVENRNSPRGTPAGPGEIL